MSNDIKKLAAAILQTVGAENIIGATNCMTRLRLHLKRRDQSMLDQLKGLEGVLGLNDDGDELQIILGPGRATNVTNELRELLSTVGSSGSTVKIGDGSELRAEIKARNATPIKLFFKKIASIFLPLIPGFIACGLITGCVGLALKLDPTLAGEPMIKLLTVAGNTVFWGMNLFVGFNAAKVFEGTPILGGILAALITHPSLSEVVLSSGALVPGRGGVISVILVAALGAFVEKKLHRLVPEMFDLFITPLLTFLIAGAAAIFVLQPLGGVISETIGRLATDAIQSGGAIVGAVLAGFWLPMVMLGVHQAMTPIHVDLISQYGVTILLPILAMAGAGQVGASIAVYFKTKNKFLKKTIASALPVGMMGVGEPLIYGVTLPLGKPFVGACIGGAFGGAFEAANMVGAATLGISGIPLAAATNNILIYFFGLLISYAAGFAATWLIGFDDPIEQ